MERIGVRELRQNLSVYLRRVEAGEILEVTERGRPVALLAPHGASDGPVERLVASGRAIAPTRSLADLGPALSGPSLGDALADERAERLPWLRSSIWTPPRWSS